ncbi:hypothetical protein [Dinoroseobacter sp. S124A]|uniref:hypothetical protein n=1 Tax=Dinoroseobacter sp. S124A TaxID=3415128 RepID=UPI003C7C929D
MIEHAILAFVVIIFHEMTGRSIVRTLGTVTGVYAGIFVATIIVETIKVATS